MARDLNQSNAKSANSLPKKRYSDNKSMDAIRKVLLIGLSSRILVIGVVVLCSFLFIVPSLQPTTNSLPIVNLFNRFDSYWYTRVAMNGYPLGYPSISYWDGRYFNAYVPNPILARPEWAFFPLYPAAMRAVSLLFAPFSSETNALELAGFIVSNIAFFFSAYFFYKLTNKIFKQPKIALVATIFFSFYPGAVFYSAIYTEALFMALALGAFYFLEEDKLPIAVLLGFLASFTRSDGFLICIPFIVYAIQSIRNKPKALKLVASSALVASPLLIFQLAGYVLAGHVFPISVLAKFLNWGIYPVLTTQLILFFHNYIKSFAFDMAGLAIMFMPTAYFIYRLFSGSIKDTLIQEAKQLKYWAFYASMIFVIVFQTNINDVVRYGVTLIPIYWVSAIIYAKNRLSGIVLFVFFTVMLVGASLLFEHGLLV